MNDKNFLILGAAGQLGSALRQKYPGARATDIGELDITDPKSVENFDWSKIKIVFNAAAYTNVDGAQTPKGRKAAWRVNAHAVMSLARAAVKHNLTLFHISTDYVFDGTQDNHLETETFSPISVYGASKAAGDLAAASAPKHYILRASWVIGNGPNFVRTMIGLAEKNVSPEVVSDQIGRLTFTSTLVDAINHLLNPKSQIPNPKYGTYNVTNDGEPASWADITKAIFKELGRDDLSVTDTTTAEYFADKPNVAQRPLKSTLDLTKIKATGFKPTGWKSDLSKYIRGPHV